MKSFGDLGTTIAHIHTREHATIDTYNFLYETRTAIIIKTIIIIIIELSLMISMY